jgi:hypothetical protein
MTPALTPVVVVTWQGLDKAGLCVGRFGIRVEAVAALDANIPAIDVRLEEPSVLLVAEPPGPAVGDRQGRVQPIASSAPSGPTGALVTCIQARSMSSTDATPCSASVVASRFSALYIALNT